MKVYKTNEIRNISLIGAKGSGKTTLSESILFEGGVIKRRGTVEAKNTVCDYFPVEQEYGYSVFPTLFSVENSGRKFNFIDCPGSDDFVGGSVTAMGVTEASLLLINAQYGPEVGTQNAFRNAENSKQPIIFCVNHMDKDFDFDVMLSNLREAYGPRVMPVQFPVNPGGDFNAVIDVVMMKKLTWAAEGGAPKVEDIPADLMDKAQEVQAALIEAAAENDEALMDKYFETETLTPEEIIDGIRKGLTVRGIYPLVCICASRDMGISRMLEFVGEIAPSPLDMPLVKNTKGEEVALDATAPLSAFFFKTSMEPHIGEVSYFKVMRGTMKENMDAVNADRSSKERIGQIFTCAGSNRMNIAEIPAGDLGCTVKLKDVKTGNTLCENGKEMSFDFIVYPNSKYSRSIKADNESETEKMMAAIFRMHQEDPTWIVEQSKELRQTIVSGQGEFHLRTLKWRLENLDKIVTTFGEPRIPYRETITKQARADYRHKKQSGGAGQFGEVHLIVEPYTEGMPDPVVYKFGGQEFKVNIKGKEEFPLDWGGKLVFINSVVGGAIDTRFMPAIQKGIMDCMNRGPLTGSYARDVRVVVYDGKMHPVDSNELSFMLAGRNAFSAAFKEAGPKILEPIYDVEVLVPSDYMGDVMSDLQGRRAIIMGMDSEGSYQILKAKVPLKEMQSYSITLSSLTGGRASFNSKFASYELVPNDVQTELIKAHEAELAEEDK